MSIHSAVFLRTPQQRLPMLFTGVDKPQNFPSPWQSRPHIIHGSFGPPESAISIGSSVFAGPTNVTNTDRHTDTRANRPRYSVSYAMHAMWHKTRMYWHITKPFVHQSSNSNPNPVVLIWQCAISFHLIKNVATTMMLTRL